MRHKFGRFSVSIFAALALSLSAGCAAVSQDGSSNSSVASSELSSDFTIDGKPTETIETPWGPREIYDPTQDAVVRRAAQYIYDNNADPLFYASYNGFEHDGIRQYGQKEKDPRFQDQDALISLAVWHKRMAYQDLGCRRLVEAQCGGFTGRGEILSDVQKKDCKATNPNAKCEYRRRYAQANTRGQCQVGGKTAYNRGDHPLGTSFFSKSTSVIYLDLSETPDFQTQFENLFVMHCNDWMSKSPEE